MTTTIITDYTIVLKIVQPFFIEESREEFFFLGSPSGFSPVSFNPTSDSENTDGESEPAPSNNKKYRNSISPRGNHCMDERRDKAAEFAQMLHNSPAKKPKYSPFKKLCIKVLHEQDFLMI